MSLTHPAMADRESAVAGPTGAPRRLSGVEFFLVGLVVASFAYEQPLFHLTPYYKTEPRLFHFAAFLLIFYWLLIGQWRGWRLSLKNPVLAPWLAVIGVFLGATLISGLFVPFHYWRFSLFYMARYLEGLLVLIIVFSAPIDEKAKRRLLWIALLGGAWVAFYAMLQFFGIVSTERLLPSGEDIPQAEGAIWSTLGTSYFHVGQFSVISGLIGFAIFRASRGLPRILAAFLAPFCIIPSVISGARAAFASLLLAMGFLVLQREYRRYVSTFLIAALMAILLNYFYTQSLTAERLGELVGTAQGVVGRVFHGPRTLVSALESEGPRLLIVGGGFYVVPIDGHYRVGYGNHNIFLFPLEQAGIGAFIAATWLWIRLGLALGRRRSDFPDGSFDQTFRLSMFAYYFSIMAVGFTGSAFWLGVSTENLAIYTLLVFGLAVLPTGSARLRPSAAGELYSPDGGSEEAPQPFGGSVRQVAPTPIPPRPTLRDPR